MRQLPDETAPAQPIQEEASRGQLHPGRKGTGTPQMFVQKKEQELRNQVLQFCDNWFIIDLIKREIAIISYLTGEAFIR